MTTAAVGSLRCSAWARTVELDPGGTAGSYAGFLVIDEPLPWPRDVAEIGEVAGIADLLGGSGLRVQARISSPDAPRRVALYRREDDARFRGFSGRSAEFSDDAGSLRETLSALLAGQGSPIVGGRELLVCTHGRRDVCCGALGTELHALLSTISLPSDVQLGRTSHTGGHRFAPTFVVLPEATLWAFADVELVDRVLSREGDASAAADHYRGSAGLPGPRVQVLEREVLRRMGWDLLSCARSGSDTGSDGRVRLEVETVHGQVEAWEATVVPGRELPVPDCGRPIEEARKTETEWEVRDLRRL
ncbi:MAG TPA: sucrase ferredoxin [Acidimicrobiales bacterium]|nr:sucrase ferredoxin [Acidimicrobiales bacterium]